MNDSLTKPPFIPVWTKNFRETIFFLYNGPSMAPLFKPGDLLCAQHTNFQKIKPGDIVIFTFGGESGDPKHIVHRVISSKRTHWITRGDNNLHPDKQIVSQENYVGLVTSFSREGRVRSVTGGVKGLCYVQLIFLRNSIWSLVKHISWRMYRFVRQNGYVAYFWNPTFSQIWLNGKYGPWVKFLHHGHTIASWWPQQNHFKCKKPFDLVLLRKDLSVLSSNLTNK